MDDSERATAERGRALERVTDAVVGLDSDLRCTYHDPEVEQLFETTTGTLRGEPIWEAFPDEIAPTARERIENAGETGDPARFEWREGSQLFDVRVYPDEDGVSLLFVDATGRDREVLGEKTSQLEAIVEASPDPMVMVDENLEARLWNSAAERVFGWSKDEILGEYAPHVPDEKDEEFRQFIENIQQGDQNRFVETVRRAKDGERIDVSLSSAKVEVGDQVGYVAIFKDIRQRKEYERMLEAQRDHLDVLNRMIRHDIRNELQLILSYTQLLLERVDEDEREYVETIRSNAETINDLTRTARELAEAMMGAESDREPVPLDAALERQLTEVRSKYPNAVVTVAGPLPDVSVLADDTLASVFRNLLTNAVVHNDTEIPEVAVSAERTPDSVVVRIADNGPGVPDDRKQDIFGRGEKGLGSTGTGIGLYLVDTLVDQYGGEVWVEDRAGEENEGAVFAVELDRA